MNDFKGANWEEGCRISDHVDRLESELASLRDELERQKAITATIEKMAELVVKELQIQNERLKVEESIPLATHNVLVEHAEERAARRLAEYLVHESEHSCSSVDDLMTIWKRLK